MNQESYQFRTKKKRNNSVKAIIVVIFALLLGIGGTISFLYLNGINIFAQEEKEPINEEIIPEHLEYYSEDIFEEESLDYVEIVGYGPIKIDSSFPNLELKNVETNDVMLSFNVLNNSKSIYQSNKILPGNSEQFNALQMLDEGEHILTYEIKAYDLNNDNIVLSDITQIQEVIVEGDKWWKEII